MIAEKGVTVVYDAIALGAKEAFNITASEKAQFASVEQLKQSGAQTGVFENPVDGFGIPLDGNSAVIPSFIRDEKLGYWSEQITDKDGLFVSPIVMTFESKEKFDTEGVILKFDDTANVICIDLNIKWYSDGRMILSEDFAPDSAVYSCVSRVNKCDKIVITFNRLNSPYDRLRIKGIEYGRGYYFYGSELKNVSVTQEFNALSSEIPISTTDISMQLIRDADLNFKNRQPITTYFNGKLQAKTFVKKARRTAKNAYSISTEDYISILDSVTYEGGIYGGQYAVDVIKDIFKKAGVPFVISGDFSNEKLYGYIPYSTCRKALMLVCFAIGAVVSTAYIDYVSIFKLSESISQTIPKSRIRQGQSFGEETKVTAVSLTYHAYYQTGEKSTVLYDAQKEGTGNEILVKFSAPKYGLTIENGEILEKNANYAVINAFNGCKLSGSEYSHRQGVKTKYVNKESGETENIISIKDATLISANNVDKILDICYNELKNNDTVNMSIIEGKHVIESAKSAICDTFLYDELRYDEGASRSDLIVYDPITHIGEIVTTETEYLGNVTGRITRQTYNLNGNIIVKNTVLNKI